MTIQQLNDAFRTSLSADLGRIVMTSGVASLDAETIAQILDAVRTYDQFDEDIDPYGEHDMGRFTVVARTTTGRSTTTTGTWSFTLRIRLIRQSRSAC